MPDMGPDESSYHVHGHIVDVESSQKILSQVRPIFGYISRSKNKRPWIVTPKQVTERHDDSGHELGGKSLNANGTSLESWGSDSGNNLPVVGGTNAPNGVNGLSQGVSPQEIVVREPSDIVSEAILAHADPLMKVHLQMLQEQYESSMQMHRHYKEIAVNGTEADLGTTSADDMALSYLRQATQISQSITSMVNEMLRTSTKKALEREKIRGKVAQKLPDGAHVTQNNTIITFTEADQREKLRMMDQFAGNKKMDGTLGIPDAKTLIDSITNTKDDRKNEEQRDAE